LEWECLSATLPRLPDLGANCSEWPVSAQSADFVGPKPFSYVVARGAYLAEVNRLIMI
jgi:hypothetical protein